MTAGNADILFDKFSIQSCIKKDSHTGIYIADHIYLGKKIFLKTLNQENLTNPAVMQRFQREAKLLAQIEHPNIIKVWDFGTRENWFYISFEYFKSRDLRKVLRESSLSEEQKLNIFIGITRGLDAAHQLNIIHRDIKPENILIDDQYHVKIADFGLALVKDEPHSTQQESIVGTPGYMSPEQIRGELLTTASDLFSLGIVGCELISGSNPFLGKDAGETLNNILSRDCSAKLTENAHSEETFNTAVGQLLNKKVKDRPQSCNQVLKILHAEQVESRQTPISAQKGRKKSVVYLLMALFFISVAIIWATHKRSPGPVMVAGQGPDSARVATDSVLKDIPDPVPDQRLIPVEVETDMAEPDDNMVQMADPAPQTGDGSLYIQCSPWAEVWIDSQHVDTTPLEDEILLNPGEYELMLKHPDYPDYVQTLQVLANGEHFVNLALDTLCGYLQCELYPWGEVVVDDRTFGITPLPDILRLSPGEHLLKVINNTYGSVQETLHVARNETLIYQFNFERLVMEKQK